MNITQTTVFPSTPAMAGGNTVVCVGTTGTELKALLNTALQAKVDAGNGQATAAAAAQSAVNS